MQILITTMFKIFCILILNGDFCYCSIFKANI